jgi:hypothetical protein
MSVKTNCLALTDFFARSNTIFGSLLLRISTTFTFTLMEREQTFLLRDRTEREVDARKRLSLREGERMRRRQERTSAASQARVTTIRKQLKQWEDAHVTVVTDSPMTEPQPFPLAPPILSLSPPTTGFIVPMMFRSDSE